MKTKFKKVIIPVIMVILCVAVVVVLVVRSTAPPPKYATRWFTAEEWKEYQFLDTNMINIQTDQMAIEQLIKQRDWELKKRNPSDYDKKMADAYVRAVGEQLETFEREYGIPVTEKNINEAVNAVVERMNGLGTTERVDGVAYVAHLDDVLIK